AVPFQEPQGNKAIEEIIGAACVQPHSQFKLATCLRTVSQRGKESELHCTQKCLRRPEPHTNLHDVIWRNVALRHGPSLPRITVNPPTRQPAIPRHRPGRATASAQFSLSSCMVRLFVRAIDSNTVPCSVCDKRLNGRALNDTRKTDCGHWAGGG